MSVFRFQQLKNVKLQITNNNEITMTEIQKSKLISRLPHLKISEMQATGNEPLATDLVHFARS